MTTACLGCEPEVLDIGDRSTPAIDVLVGALAANVRAMAEGDVEAVQAPPR